MGVKEASIKLFDSKRPKLSLVKYVFFSEPRLRAMNLSLTAGKSIARLRAALSNRKSLLALARQLLFALLTGLPIFYYRQALLFVEAARLADKPSLAAIAKNYIYLSCGI
jgi:hypothetical protein